MKKNIFLLLSITSLTACATFQQQQTFDWRGQNFDNYVLTYGVPTSQYTLQNGNNVYSFKTNCPDTNAQEELLITINTDNVIENVSLTAACPYVRPEPVQEIYITKYIETPEPRPMPREKISSKPQPAPKPHKEVKPAPAPAPAPQKPTQPQVAPKPQPSQNKPEPKPQEQPVISAPQKPAQDKPEPKENNSSIINKMNKPNTLIIGQKNTEPQKDTSANVKQESVISKKLEKTKKNNTNIILYGEPAASNTQKEKTTKAETQAKVSKLLGKK